MNLNNNFYLSQVNRLISAYGQAAFSQERLRLIERHVSEIPEEVFQGIIDFFISNNKYAPLPNDFKEAVYSWRKTKGDFSGEHKALPYVVECHDCYNTGFLFCEYKERTIVCFCHCYHCENAFLSFYPNGKFGEKSSQMHKWDGIRSEQLGMKKIPFPVEWFKPASEEERKKITDGKFLNGMSERMHKWQKVKINSERFWATV